MVREAQSSKAPAQRLADLAGKYLVIVALASGVVTFVVWLVLGHQGVAFALSAAVAAIVIACPDALALATPTAITVGVGRAARAGVLFRNAAVLEAAAKVDTVVFDKTGTLTEGRPSVTDVIPAAGVKRQRFSGSPLQRMRSRSTPSPRPLSRLPRSARLPLIRPPISKPFPATVYWRQ
jgi:Cu2+-exporting ATPase